MRQIFGWVAALSVVAGCGGDSATATQSTSTTAASVVVTVQPTGIAVGETAHATAVVRDDAGHVLGGRTPQWTSSQPGVASIDGEGRIRGLDAGDTRITATVDGVSGSADFSVRPPGVSSVRVTLSASTVQIGDLVTATAVARSTNGDILTGRQVAWRSSTPSVATVTATGHITAMSPGTTEISAIIDGVGGTATLSVMAPPVATVKVLGTSRIKAGDPYNYTAEARLADGTLVSRPVTWSVVESDRATITPGGILVATVPGTITVHATVDGITAGGSVVVYDWTRVNSAGVIGVAIPADVPVTNKYGTESYPVLGFACSSGFVVGVLSLSSFVTANGNVSYSFDGGPVTTDVWSEGSEFDYLAYPGTSTATLAFANRIAASTTFGFAFNEFLGGAHATIFRVSGLAPYLNEIRAACSASATRTAQMMAAPTLEQVLRQFVSDPLTSTDSRAQRRAAGSTATAAPDSALRRQIGSPVPPTRIDR